MDRPCHEPQAKRRVRQPRVEAGTGLNFKTTFYGHEKAILQLATGEIRLLEMHMENQIR
jgi:hypothetical protein